VEFSYSELRFDTCVEKYASLINYEYNKSLNLIRTLIALAHIDGDYSQPEQDAIKSAIKILKLPEDVDKQVLYDEIVCGQIEELKVKRFGTGFFINDDGFIITNNHVVKKANNIKVRYFDKFIDAKIVMRDEDFDLCLLKVDDKSKGLFFNSKLKSGQEIFTYGYPQPEKQGYLPKLTKGVISSTFGANDDVKIFQIDAAIQPGNSGSPVIDCKNGGITGLVCSELQEGQNVNYAVRIDIILKFLEKIKAIRQSVKFKGPNRSNSDQIIQNVNMSTVQILSCK
jgi:S1-C subfamily serine protease